MSAFATKEFLRHLLLLLLFTADTNITTNLVISILFLVILKLIHHWSCSDPRLGSVNFKSFLNLQFFYKESHAVGKNLYLINMTRRLSTNVRHFFFCI